MRIEESGLYYRKVLCSRGFRTVEEVVYCLQADNLKLLKNIGYVKLVNDLHEKGFLSSKDRYHLVASYHVRRDFPYVSAYAFESKKTEGEKDLSAFREWLLSCGIGVSYIPVALLYEIGKLQESVMHCIREGKCCESGDFLGRLRKLCLFLERLKKSNPLRYKMVGYIFSGISAKQITRYSGVEDVQPYLRGIAEQVGGLVAIYEIEENVGKCVFSLPKVDFSELNLSMSTLFRLGDMEITSSEELYLIYRMGILENTWLFPESMYRELMGKATFLR